MRKSFLLIIIILLMTSSPLWATWSIVAVSPETGEVGSAGASYTPSVWPILGIVGGHGVLVAQAAGNERARVKAVKMLLEDVPAGRIMEEITAPEVNKKRGNQQFGIIGLGGGSAGFTGEECTSWAGHMGNDLVMVQGNILVSEAVVADTLAVYNTARANGVPLAEALVTALAAGSAVGGDKRSGDIAVAAMTAYVAVASPEDPPGHASFAIIVPPLSNGGNPVTKLERLYREKAGSPQHLFFPSMTILVLLFIFVPAAVGLALFFVFSAVRKKTNTLAALVWASSVLGALAAQQIVIIVLGRMEWALPVYGYFAKIYPIMLAIILCIIFLIVSLIQRIARKQTT